MAVVARTATSAAVGTLGTDNTFGDEGSFAARQVGIKCRDDF